MYIYGCRSQRETVLKINFFFVGTDDMIHQFVTVYNLFKCLLFFNFGHFIDPVLNVWEKSQRTIRVHNLFTVIK